MNGTTNARLRATTRRGFSLVELLIAIAILLAIGGLVVVNLIPKKAQADIDLTRAQIDSIEQAIKFFMVDMNRYPSEEEGLAVLWKKSVLEDEADEAKWKGKYLENPISADVWGNEWVYEYPSEERENMYKIASWGPDGEEGTDDDITSFDRFRDEEGELSDEFDEFDSGATGG